MKEVQTPYFTFLQYHNPFEDPHLLIKDKRMGEDILFDCGDLSKIPPHELMSVKHIFITHFHMDHFIGFSQILRIFLSAPSSRVLHIYGPEGLAKYAANTIDSFNWNLLGAQNFSLSITEVRKENLWVYPPHVFHEIPYNMPPPSILPLDSSTLYENPLWAVESLPLDHKIPVLGFRLVEKPQAHFIEIDCPYPKGPWIKQTKQSYFQTKENPIISISPNLELPLQELRKYFSVSLSSHFPYLTDFLYDPDNVHLQNFVKEAQILFIESHFLSKDELLAQKTYHLSTKDVAHICHVNHPKKVYLFHFSRRYLSLASYKDFFEEVQYWKNENL